MMRRLLVVSALALFIAPAVARAQFKQADWDFTISGTAANDKDFRTFSLGANGSLGYFVIDQLEVGLRQTLTISDGGSQWVGNTGVFGDWHFDLGKFVPFVGANIGYAYGGGDAEDGFSAGPEVGLKYFVNGTTYVFGIATYEFNLNRGFDSGGFVYALGIGFRF